MYDFFQIVYHSIYNIIYTFKSPFFWLIIGIIFFQYRKVGKIEKNILGRYKRSPIYNVLISTAFGLIGGIIGSILFIYFRIIINPKDFYFILPLAILLSLIHPRFMCFSYAGGIIAIVSLIFGWPDINITTIMFVIGILHLVESFLILVDGRRSMAPIFVERQGEIIGGFNMNRFWPVPFLVFMGNGQIYSTTVIAILGYGDYALANFPEEKSKQTASLLSMFSIILILFARLSINYYMFKYIVAIFAPLGHEIIINMGKKKEERGFYIFAPSVQGLKVLDTLPNSIGGKLGLKPGDILLSINENSINTKKDIEDILYFRPKHIRINLFNIKKGLVIKEYKDYEKGISNLGIVVVSKFPEYAFVVEEGESFILRLLKNFKKRKARFKN
jgi:hypothetical protein